MSGPLKENVIGYARKRMPKRDISLIKYLSSNNWIIIYIDAPPSDPAFLFYKGLPEHRKFITLWAGAARKDEENDIFNWTRNNAPGIPEPLARCFAWYVTNSREP